MLLRLNRKGQSIAEYALVLGLVVATAIGVQAYVRTNLQHKIRQTVDAVGTGGEVIAVTNITLDNPTEDAITKEVTTATAYSKTPRKGKSLEEKDISSGGDTTITTTEISEVKDGLRKTLY